MTRRGRSGRRGLALLLVLGVVAIASVLGWAMLSTSAMRAKVEATAVDALDAAYLAESGASYAMYYLRYPELAAGKLTYKFPHGSHFHDYGDSYKDGEGDHPIYEPCAAAFTASQTGIQMWNDARGTVDLTLTSTGNGVVTVTSASIVNGIRRALVADADFTYKYYAPTHALALNGKFTVPLNMTVNGPVVTRGAVDGFNLVNFSQQATAMPELGCPKYDELRLIAETSNAMPAGNPGATTDRQYTYNGVIYNAERLATNVLTGVVPQTVNPTRNPCNVWYSDGDVTLQNATFTGTLVLRGPKKLTVLGLNTMAAKQPEMPALICEKIDMKMTGYVSSAWPRLTITGAAWVESKIENTGSYQLNAGWLKVNGALLFGGTSPEVMSSMKTPIEVRYDAAAAASVFRLSVNRKVNGLNVRQWRHGA